MTLSARTAPVLAACAALLASTLAAQEAPAPSGDSAAPLSRVYPLRPADGAVQVDGRLDEPTWAAAVPVDLPYESYPGEESGERTRMDLTS